MSKERRTISASSLPARLKQHAEDRPEAIAYRLHSSGTLTYRQLADQVDAFAHWLSDRVPRGATIILSCPSDLKYPVAFLGLLAAGCSVFPILLDASDMELSRAATESGAVGIVGDHRTGSHGTSSMSFLNRFEFAKPGCPTMRLSLLRKGPETNSNSGVGATGRGTPKPVSFGHEADTSLGVPLPVAPRTVGSVEVNCAPLRSEIFPQTGALLLQSSGTTGLPKIVRRSGASLDAVAQATAEAIGFTVEDRVLMTVPLTHSYGLEHGLLAPIWAGSSIHLCPGLDLQILLPELASGITIFPGVPSTFEMLANLPGEAAPMPGLRAAYSAGAPLPRSVFDRFLARYGIRITQLYGATEVGSVTFNPPSEPFDPASVGRAMRGVSIRILDAKKSGRAIAAEKEGEIAIRAESMFGGYLNAKSELIDGHFPTGDLGHIDAGGRLFVTGRLKLLIDVGGLKVNPLEVEAVLQQHPEVAACAVIAALQTATVNRLKAFIEPRDPSKPPAIEELRQLARTNLSAYKVPRFFGFITKLPRSPTGKILRHLLEVK